MIFSFFKRRSSDATINLLVDIGSASVAVSHIRLEKGKAPVILSTFRENLSFQEVLSSGRFLIAMNHALDRALKALQKASLTVSSSQRPLVVSDIFCTLSSPWFILKNRHLHIAPQGEFLVTEDALDEFIKSDIERLKDELKAKLPPHDIRIIEKKIIQMKLNGYEVKNPYGQKTSQLDVLMTVGVSSGKVIESIERKLKNFFHIKTIHFGTFPVAAFSAIRDIFPFEKNFLFLDITGEATDVSVVENDVLKETTSFSKGKNFFIREISAELNTIHEEAATLFSMFLRGELSGKKQAQIERIIKHAEREWFVRFEKALNVLSEKGSLPHKIFLTTDPEVAPMFSSIIEQVTNTSRPEFSLNENLHVQHLDQFIVSRFVSFEAGVTRDPFIVVQALLAEKIYEQLT